MKWRAWLRNLLARFKKETPMPDLSSPQDLWYDASYMDGSGSYYDNAKSLSGGDWSSIFPPGWGQPGETPEDTTWRNVVEGLWLPLHLPAGFEGHNPNAPVSQPAVIFYANVPSVQAILNTVAPQGTPDGDQARWDKACHLALEAASGSSGSPYVRE
jgi:hypothetical protein